MTNKQMTWNIVKGLSIYSVLSMLVGMIGLAIITFIGRKG